MRIRILPITLLLAVASIACVLARAASADTPATKPKSTARSHSAASSTSSKTSSSKTSTAKSGAAKPSKHHPASGKSGANKSTPASSGKSAGSKSTAAEASSGKSGKRASSKSSSRHAPGQKAPTPERITEIQQALAKNGALVGEPSGKWDDSTTDGMRKFQAAHGLNPTGKLDALTLRQLGLGSSTAGMGAPTISSKTSASTLPSDVAAPQQ